MIRRPPRSTLSSSSAASDVYKRELQHRIEAAASAGLWAGDAGGANVFGDVPGVLGQRGVVHGRNTQRGSVSVADQPEVVDSGVRRRVGTGFGFGARVDVAPDLVADRDTHVPALVADLQIGQVEGVEDELDAASDQGGVDFVGVAVQRYRRGLGDQATLGPQERLM